MAKPESNFSIFRQPSMIKLFSRRNSAASRFAPGGRSTTLVIPLMLAGILCAGPARAASETPIYDFTGGDDGAYPRAGLIRDPAAEKAGIVPVGTLFGTSDLYGQHGAGQHGRGTLFMLVPPRTSGEAWTMKVLRLFGPPSSRGGSSPATDLTVDTAGNLYGTTAGGGGGPIEGGTVFELSPPATGGGEWAYRVLVRFKGLPSLYPNGKLTLDPSGDGVLYGTTLDTVFSLTPPGVNGNPSSRWAVSHQNFFGWPSAMNPGYNPQGTLVFDHSSPPNLFGTTHAGGQFADGAVFELLPPNSTGNPLQQWSATAIYAFKGEATDDGAQPNGLIIDGDGVLYGTTVSGGHGPRGGFGTVFEILPPSLSTTGEWERVILHRFRGRDGMRPTAGLLLDAATGKLFGTTSAGGNSFHGTVFELAPSTNRKVWTESVLASFTGQQGDGSHPDADLNFGADGNLYGTTFHGGLYNDGTVFQVTLP
jgi:uncharacterized repeat protein (TIGR03803 family)